MSDAIELRAALMREKGWTSETRFFRYNLRAHVSPGEDAGTLRVSANPDPSEAVEDIYGGGHTSLASTQGPGLAFSEAPDEQWSSPDHVCLSIRLGDALDQGGFIYPVQSVITADVYFVTLPAGSILAVEV